MLPTPGNVTPMPQDTTDQSNQIPAPAAQAPQGVPPLPGVGAPPAPVAAPAGGPPPLPGVPQSGAPAGAPPIPGQVSQAVHQPGPPPVAPAGAVPAGEPAPIPPADEEAAVTVVDTQPVHGGQVIDQQAAEVVVQQEAPPPIPAPQQAAPPPIPQAQPAPAPAPAQAAPPAPTMAAPPAAPAQVAPAPVPQQAYPQGMVPQQAPAAQPMTAAPAAGVPAGFAAGGIQQQLAAMGFEGLDMGFGSFPIVKLQDQSFTTSDGDQLGNTFVCVMHQTRRKFLFKCDDSNDSEEMVYSYDKQTTTTGKSIEDVKAEWAAKGWVAPVWKEYTDVTAQLVDLTNREMGGVVVLSVPHTSNSRLSGYMTTLLVKGRQPNQVITQVYPGQRITSAKKPFYPWAFREYTTVQALLGG